MDGSETVIHSYIDASGGDNAAGPYPRGDREFKDEVIDEVHRYKDGTWNVSWDGCGISFQADGVEPKVGDTIRLYGRGLGYPVRGIFINGKKAYYRTPAEEEDHHAEQVAEMQRKERADFEEHRAELDAKFDALPEVFRRRIERFRSNNPDFRWEFEKYELFCCEQALLMAAALKTPEAVQEFAKKGWAEQKAAVPGLDDGHSGNTFGMAVRLAYHYLYNPEIVPLTHGALASLVGCDEYGCPPPKLTEEQKEMVDSGRRGPRDDVDSAVDGIRRR